MNYKTFFSKQARNPSGLYGRFVMSRIFDRGNTVLNDFMRETLTLQEGDRVLEVGFGTGKLIREMARQTGDQGLIEGVDFSGTMARMTKRRNRKSIAEGRVNIVLGDFDRVDYPDNHFDRICSANTIYFWPDAQLTARKMYRILKDGGKLVIGFGDIARQLDRMPIDTNVFNIYSQHDVEQLLTGVGFSSVETRSKEMISTVLYCAIAVK